MDLPPELASFRFQLSDDPAAAIRASLKLLDVGPDRITIPVYGGIWRAILGSPDFSLLLYGATGVFKTELAPWCSNISVLSSTHDTCRQVSLQRRTQTSFSRSLRRTRYLS